MFCLWSTRPAGGLGAVLPGSSESGSAGQRPGGCEQDPGGTEGGGEQEEPGEEGAGAGCTEVMAWWSGQSEWWFLLPPCVM